MVNVIVIPDEAVGNHRGQIGARGWTMSGMTDSKLIIFVKALRTGTVKTRLARDVGNAEALRIYKGLVEQVVENAKAVRNVELRFTPDDAGDEVAQWLQGSWTSVAQGAGDLGDRMFRVFEESFAQGTSKTVIIGSDCPTISAADVQQAFNALEIHDLVIGPSTDGGYWLIGLNRPVPELFSDMAWSTSGVLEETVRRAENLGLKYQLLSEKNDIDDLKSWQAYLANLPDENSF